MLWAHTYIPPCPGVAVEIVSPVSEGQAPRIENSERLSPSDLLRAYADATGMPGESLQCGLQLLQVKCRVGGVYRSGRQTMWRVSHAVLFLRASSILGAHALLTVSSNLVTHFPTFAPFLDSPQSAVPATNSEPSATTLEFHRVEVENFLSFHETVSYPLDDRFTLRLNAYNLFDKRYVAAINKSGYRYSPGTPRTFVFSVDYSF